MQITATTINSPTKFYTLDPPCKKYVALLSQTGTNAPVAIVLENTIGDIVWSYSNVGEYIATLSNAFYNHTFIVYGSLSNVFAQMRAYNNDADTVYVETINNLGNEFNGLLSYTSIEIRVYS